MWMMGNDAEKQADGRQINIDTAIFIIQTEAITLAAEILEKTEDGGYAIEKALSILKFTAKITGVLSSQEMFPGIYAECQGDK